MLKLLGLVCAGVFVSAAYIELRQVRSKKRANEPTDEHTTDEETDGDAGQQE